MEIYKTLFKSEVHVPGLLAFRNPMLSFPLTVFTIFSLFILPRGLLVLDMVPRGIAWARRHG